MKLWFACLSAALAIPAFAAPARYVDVSVAPPSLGRAAASQAHPVVATDGRDFLAVWLDNRGSSSVYGTRVLADGTVLDPSGILISAPGDACGSSCSGLSLTWDGSNYVVVWQSSTGLSFTRVSRDGTVLDASKTLFLTYFAQPSIASNGHGSVVIAGSSGGFLCARISQDGSFTQRATLPIAHEMQIASNGDGYLAFWADSRTHLLRLDDNGDMVAGSEQQLTETNYTQLTAGIGGPYLLSGSFGSTCVQRLPGRLVTSSGLSAPFLIYDAGGEDIGSFSVSPDRNGFQFVWMKRLGPYPCKPANDSDPPSFTDPDPPFGLAQIHVGADGSVGPVSTLAGGTVSHLQPTVASNGATQLLVWVETSDAYQNMRVAAAITHPGEQLVPIPIASSAAPQSSPAIAAAENMFMTAWTEANPIDERTTIYAKRFTTDGRAIDAAAIKVSAESQSRNLYPAVSFDGNVWLFVWSGDYLVTARRMAANGTWIDATPLTIGPLYGASNFAVASNGNGFAILTLTANPAITLIPRTGDMRQVPISGLTDFFNFPSMAWDGNAYTAVFGQFLNNEIQGMRFAPDGQVITSLFKIANTSRNKWNPSIACKAGSCIVAWYSDGSIAAANIIGGALIPFTTMLAPTAPNTSVGLVPGPQVLATSDGFQLFWNETGSHTPALFTTSITPTSFGSPTILGATGVTSAALTAHGQLALTLVRPTYDPATAGVPRVFLRVWPSDARGRAVGK